MEPLRWMAVRYMQSMFLKIDGADEQGRSRPVGTPVALWLGRH
jgi:hypothetical protein